ncbi:hypothetical protein LT493_36340 [Streptomyces tricolor]|nr:hypothetical protein [Streptomyces tricolor]
MRAEIRSVVTRAVASGTRDVVHDIGARLSSHNIGRLLGVPPQDRERLLTWTTEAFASGRPLTSHLALMRYFIDLMYARMEEPAQDVMGMLVHNEVDGELLTETEILLGCENLVGAAENAGLSMAAGILAPRRAPGAVAAAGARAGRRTPQDRDGGGAAVDEQRHPQHADGRAGHGRRRPAHRRRRPGRAVDPVGQPGRVGVPEPDRFDLGRTPNRHLALGTGEHVCIGSTMARHQMRMLLETLTESVAAVEPAGEAEPLRSIAVNGPAHAPGRLVPLLSRRPRPVRRPARSPRVRSVPTGRPADARPGGRRGAPPDR